MDEQTSPKAQGPGFAAAGRGWRRVRPVVMPVLAATLVVLLWAWLVRYTGTKVFPAPRQVLLAMAHLFRQGLLWGYVGDSLFRVAAGYGLALVLGIPLGMAMGWWAWLTRGVDPVIQFLRPISPIAWIPVSIVLFGVTNYAAVFLVFLASFFPIVVASANGVANVPPMYLRAGRNFGLSPIAVIWRVVLPAALPQMLVGLRIGVGIAWLVVVAAEMVAVDSGLGFLIIDARNAGQRYDLVVGAMLLIGLIGLALDLFIRRLERVRSLRWGFATRSGVTR